MKNPNHAAAIFAADHLVMKSRELFGRAVSAQETVLSRETGHLTSSVEMLRESMSAVKSCLEHLEKAVAQNG